MVPQRSLAGPEPLPIPSVSEKDSAVVLPMALPGQLKLQWTLEVDPGRAPGFERASEGGEIGERQGRKQ